MQQAYFTNCPAGQPGYSRYRRLALVALAVLPMVFAAVAQEPKEKRIIRNVTPDSIPVIVLPPRKDEKPAPRQEQATSGERMIATVTEDGTVRANGHRLVLAGATTLPADTLCQSPTHGRWACGIRAFIALRTIIHGKDLKCTIVRETADGAIARCYGANTDISHRLLSEGWAIYDPTAADPLLSDAADDARKHSRGIWQNSSQPLTANR